MRRRRSGGPIAVYRLSERAETSYQIRMREHKSLLAWQVARDVTRLVVRTTTTQWHPSRRSVFDQLHRAALSVQLNIAEGYARGTLGAFRAQLRVAYGSAIEVAELIEIAEEHGMIPSEVTVEIASAIGRCHALLLGLINRYGGPLRISPAMTFVISLSRLTSHVSPPYLARSHRHTSLIDARLP